MSFLDTCASLGRRDGGKDFRKLVDTMGRQLDFHDDGVDDPAQYQLLCAKGAVTFLQFFERDRFLSCGLVVGQ